MRCVMFTEGQCWCPRCQPYDDPTPSPTPPPQAPPTQATDKAESRKNLILTTAEDLAIDFLKYDRTDDEELGRGEIEAAIEAKEIAVDEIVARFREKLEETLGDEED